MSTNKHRHVHTFIWVWKQIVLALLLAISQSAMAFESRTIEGTVVGVLDGDTVEVLESSKALHRIRLAQIDAPEKNQPYGKRAKQYLSDLVYGKTVTVEIIGDGGWNRELGRIVIAGIDVNRHLIETGHAWVYRKYSNDATLLQLETDARTKSVGLWSLPEYERIPPWEWRHREPDKKL